MNIQNFSGANNTNDEYWTLKTKDGVIYRFGFNNDSELISNLNDYAVRWSLDLITDTYDNYIYYSYQENPYPNDTGTVYPYKIKYNNDKNRVIDFIFESSDRPDKSLVYEQGNKIRESRRIEEIQIKANSNLVVKYVLNYTVFGSNSKSSLISITKYGNDNTTSFPPTTFGYYLPIAGWYVDNDFILPSSEGLLFESNKSDYGVRLLDLNRDGLIDIIKADGSNSSQNQSWINNGSGWERNDSWNLPNFVVNSQKHDLGVRFIDFNGDGFTDIVRGDGSSLRRSWQNLGNGWSNDNDSWHLPPNAHPVGEGVYERGVRFTDLNGDGLPDIIIANSNLNETWINNGSGWEQDNSWRIPPSAIFVIYGPPKDQGIRLADVNDDGLVDLVKGRDNENRTTWLNNGSGWVEDPSWTIPAGAYFVDPDSGEDEGVRFADINGDNLVDMVQRKGENIQKTWINNGNGWTRNDSWGVPSKAYFISNNGTNNGVRIVDVDGDGLVDLMNGEDPNRITFINKKGAKAYLLKNINNSLGGINTLDYIKSTSLDNTGTNNISNLGFNLWVVGTALENNGLNGSQNISFTTYYSYAGGYYDYNEKEFRGFNKVDEIRPNISIISHWFYQNDSLKGKKYKTEISDDNSNLFQKIEYDWNGTSQNDYYVTSLSKMIDYLYDGLYVIPKITETKYSYDNYGNILSINYLGDNSTQNDEKYEYLEYVYNTSVWIVDKLKHYSLYDYDNSTKIREIIFIKIII